MPSARAPRIWVFLIAFTLLALAAWPVVAQTVVAGSIEVRSDPDRLPADGRSQAVIVAEVLGPSGIPVPDGTPVRFMTTLGRIVSPVQTMGGLAQTTLTASHAAGIAVISVIAGGTRQLLEVEFTPLPGSGSPGSRTVEVNADEISYSADHCLFIATWNARLTAGGISLQADNIQYELAPNLVCAQGNVVLRSGEREVRADALRFDLLALKGRLIRLSPESVERLVVEGERLETNPDEAKEEALWEPTDTTETRTWVKARRAIIDPGEKVILDHATFYVDDIKALSLRRHVMAPTPGSAVFRNMLGYNSVGGISVDYPYYYRASAHRIGTLQLRRNALLGSQWEPGWTLGLTEEYVREGKMEGAFSLDDILNPRRGMHFEHQHQFAGGLRMNADFSTVGFEETDPRYRSASLDFFRPVGESSVTLSLAKSDYGLSREQSASLGYKLPSFRLPWEIAGTPSLSLRHSTREMGPRETFIDPVTGEPLLFNTASGTSTTANLSLGLQAASRKVGPATLSGTINTGFSQSLSGGSGGFSFSTRWTLDRQFGNRGRALLTYNYSATPASLQTGLLDTSRHTLTLSASGKVKESTLGFSVSRDISGDREYGTFSLFQPLPFGRDALGQPLWTFDVSHFFSHFEGFEAKNTQLGLSRIFGRYRASLRYSPEGVGSYSSGRPWISPFGVGYTYTGGKHLWLELSASTK